MQYLPTVWMDEFIPKMYDRPDDFIWFIDGDYYIVPDPSVTGDDYIFIVKNDEKIKFSIREKLGVFYVESDKDCKPVVPPDYPVWANQHYFDGDYSGEDSIEALFEAYYSLNYFIEPNHRYEIVVNNWRTEDFIFKTSPEPHFERVAEQPSHLENDGGSNGAFPKFGEGSANDG